MAELAALESYSSHPIAKALQAPTTLTPLSVQHHPGQGLTGTIGETDYFIGNRQLAADSQAFPQYSVLFGWNREVRGGLSFGDPVRPDASALCAALRARGVRTILLSGDSPATTQAVAEAIGSDDWIAEAAPERKVEVIHDLQRNGAKVAMLGDGVNDAPSLAQADLGIALGAGADIAMQAAPLVLISNSLTAVIGTLDLARRVHRIVRQNLFWAFVYNTTGITLAATGVLNPILAAGAMVLSSLSVIANSRRLR
jgi:P-type E1-E2 ATPase